MGGIVRFFVGLHQPSDAHHFEDACISINRLRGRKKPIVGTRVLVDSGAFTELNLYGKYRHSVDEYARELHRLYVEGVVQIEAAVAQDYMCEAFMLLKTAEAEGFGYSTRWEAEDDGAARPVNYLTEEQRVAQLVSHQQRTIERYDELIEALERLFDGAIPFPVIPVLQGYSPADYVRHLAAYGARLRPGMWVGVGSVCKRNGKPEAIAAVLSAIKAVRPDLRLHGFGVKKTSLLHALVRALLDTADSMAWSFAARKQGRDSNDWREAKAFALMIRDTVHRVPPWRQLDLFEVAA